MLCLASHAPGCAMQCSAASDAVGHWRSMHARQVQRFVCGVRVVSLAAANNFRCGVWARWPPASQFVVKANGCFSHNLSFFKMIFSLTISLRRRPVTRYRARKGWRACTWPVLPAGVLSLAKSLDTIFPHYRRVPHARTGG